MLFPSYSSDVSNADSIQVPTVSTHARKVVIISAWTADESESPA